MTSRFAEGLPYLQRLLCPGTVPLYCSTNTQRSRLRLELQRCSVSDRQSLSINISWPFHIRPIVLWLFNNPPHTDLVNTRMASAYSILNFSVIAFDGTQIRSVARIVIVDIRRKHASIHGITSIMETGVVNRWHECRE
jgi:hypothetical protein